MVHSILRRRRSLRPSTPDQLTEGAVVRTAPGDQLTVEIVGGPPGATATIQIAGSTLHQVQLDACGTGRVDLPHGNADGRLEVLVDDRVLLAGHIPSKDKE